jgi:hypothetical protein
MFSIAGIAMAVLKFFGGGNVGKLIDGTMAVIKNKTDADTINNQTGANLGLQYLTSVNETNRIKAERQTERQVIWGLFGFALPTMVIWWFALADGVPWNIDVYFWAFHHTKGTWGIAIPPEFVADFHVIVQSFFIAAPSLAGAAMLARIFKKA